LPIAVCFLASKVSGFPDIIRTLFGFIPDFLCSLPIASKVLECLILLGLGVLMSKHYQTEANMPSKDLKSAGITSLAGSSPAIGTLS